MQIRSRDSISLTLWRSELASPITSGESTYEFWDPAGFTFATPALSWRWTRHSPVDYAEANARRMRP